jgi:hypothetical protein
MASATTVRCKERGWADIRRRFPVPGGEKATEKRPDLTQPFPFSGLRKASSRGKTLAISQPARYQREEKIELNPLRKAPDQHPAPTP